MTQEESKKVFDSFYENKSHSKLNEMGTGVGLSICKQICKRLGGDIQVFSAPLSGSKFVFTMQVFDIDDVGDIKRRDTINDGYEQDEERHEEE